MNPEDGNQEDSRPTFLDFVEEVMEEAQEMAEDALDEGEDELEDELRKLEEDLECWWAELTPVVDQCWKEERRELRM